MNALPRAAAGLPPGTPLEAAPPARRGRWWGGAGAAPSTGWAPAGTAVSVALRNEDAVVLTIQNAPPGLAAGWRLRAAGGPAAGWPRGPVPPDPVKTPVDEAWSVSRWAT